MFDPEKPPELSVLRWLNAGKDAGLAAHRGKVVVVTAFQLHCKGSQKHGLPQAARLDRAFSDDEVAVVGLHIPFEEHGRQKPAALEAFIAENGIEFPVAIDQPNGHDLPKTMQAYEIQGTPTTLVFDRQGRLRRHYLGQVDDVRLGAEVMALVIEARDAPREQSIAIERRLAAALVDPSEHDHAGGCCGGHDHDHSHGHSHAHGHSHEHHHHHAEGGCCGGHDHTHDHHDHDHTHAGADDKGTDGKAGGCGDAGCGCKH